MGEAQFLNSAQVAPNKLQQSHAVFSYHHLQEMLQLNLGLL